MEQQPKVMLLTYYLTTCINRQRFSFLLKIGGIILTKTSEGNWSNGDYKLIAWKGCVLQKKGKAIYGGLGA